MEPDKRVRTIRAARSNVQGTVLRSSTRVAVAAAAAAAVVTVQAWGLRGSVGADRRLWGWVGWRVGDGLTGRELGG